jgi:hypothetical protein
MQLEALYPKPSLCLPLPSAPGVVTAMDCMRRCNRNAQCFLYGFSNGTCSLCTQEAAMLRSDLRGSFVRGLPTKHVSGTPSRPFVLFSSPWVTSGREARTLLVVHFHWRASLRQLEEYAIGNMMKLPLDVDVVMVQPYAHAWTLANPWTGHGVLSYLSLVVASNALPGYRDYLFVNDDSPVFYHNRVRNVTTASWAAPDAAPGHQMFSSMPLDQRTWQWFGSEYQPANDRDLLGRSERADNRSFEALLALNVSADFIY